jgi:phosphatidylglycerol:prolipoprotein diacylglycerol transferase
VAGLVAGAATLQVRGSLRLSTLAALCIAVLGLVVGAKLQSRLEYQSVSEALEASLTPFATPGMRLPLGLLTGAVLALGWCALVRAPVLATGDALAVAASTLIPIGRIGCLLNGCCMGGVCPAWMASYCPRYGRGSDVWIQQLRDHVILADQVVALPAQPLPMYFAAASVGTLVVLLWLLRRGVAPGGLLATFCILRPAAKLALEPLRASPVAGPLQIAIPSGVLLVTVAVLGIRWLLGSPSPWGFSQAGRQGGATGFSSQSRGNS